MSSDTWAAMCLAFVPTKSTFARGVRDLAVCGALVPEFLITSAGVIVGKRLCTGNKNAIAFAVQDVIEFTGGTMSTQGNY